jgi:hypothetical protein
VFKVGIDGIKCVGVIDTGLMQLDDACFVERFERLFAVGLAGVLGNGFSQVMARKVQDVPNARAISQTSLAWQESFAQRAINKRV